MSNWNYLIASIGIILLLLVIAEGISLINITFALGWAALIAYFIIAICLVIIAYYLSFLKDIAFYLMEINNSIKDIPNYRSQLVKKR